MSKLVWDNIGERFYETGVKMGVLYPSNEQGSYATGVAWNGLTAVTESPSGAEATALYADDIKYLSLLSAEEFGATIEAYTYPDEFKACNGEADLVPGVTVGQQVRHHFGFSYQTVKGNDTEGTDYGYIIHIVFDCMASPSEKGYSTINDSPEAITFSWEISSNPVPVPGYKPSANMTIDSSVMIAQGFKNVLTAIENKIYGTATTQPTLPKPAEIQSIFQYQAYLQDSSSNPILDSNGNKIQSFVSQ